MIDFDFSVVFVVFIVAFLLQFLVVRTELRSIFDPILFFVLTSSFSITFAVLVITDYWLLFRIGLYYFAFWGGYFVVVRSRRSASTNTVDYTALKIDSVFSVLTICSVFLVVLPTFYLWSVKGIPIFSPDPSLAKVENFTEGGGIVRRLNWGLGIFASLASLYWAMYSRRVFAWFCLGLIGTTSLLSGNKSGLLILLMGIGLYLYHPFLDMRGQKISDKVKKFTWPVIVLALVPVLVVLGIESKSDESSDVAIAFGQRLMAFGDSLLYWGQDDLRRYFSAHYPPQDYLLHILNPILGFFRLAEYQYPIGFNLVQFSLAVNEELAGTLGPNTPFYVKGELFFGMPFALVYSFVIGCVVATFRRNFVGARSTLTEYCIKATLAVIVMTIPTEDTLFISQFFDFFIFFIPLYFLVRIVYQGVPRRETQQRNI